MFKSISFYFAFFLVLILGLRPALAANSSEEVYLSFEEKVLINYGLLAYQKPQAEKAKIYERALQYMIEASAIKIADFEVRNFQEFLDHFRGEWPNSGDLEKDLKRIETQPKRGVVIYKSQSPRIQRQIDAYLTTHQTMLAMANLSTLKGETDLSLEKVEALSEKFITKQIEGFNSIGEKISTSGASVITDPTVRIVLQTLFNEYFGRQSLESKKQMITVLLNANLLLGDEAKLEMMIQNSGPQFQKLLQVVARQGGLPENLQRSFKKLESAVKPVPWWQVQELLAKENANYKFTYFERKPLGVGTMAQVHRAKILWNGKRKDVVARFIKPDMAKKVSEDHRILTEVAKIIDLNSEYRKSGGPLMTPLIKDITETVRAELDQKATIERQLKARDAYRQQVFLNTPEYKNILDFYVPEVFTPKSSSQLMVQELITGKSLDKEIITYKESIPNLKKSVVEEMAKIWAKEVLFGTGFYHADLHQGNYLVQVMDEKIRVTVLDYGMGGVLNETLRHQVIILGAAMALKNLDMIANSYWDMSEKAGNKISKSEFKERVQNRLNELARKRNSVGLEQWTGWVSDQGVKIPYDLINLSRGMIIIDNSLKEAGSTERTSSIAEALAKRNLGKVYTALSEKGFKAKDLTLMGFEVFKNKFQERRPAPTSGVSCKSLF